MRVLVSGAGGFVGAHVESELSREGHAAAGMTEPGELDAVIHLTPNDTRTVLDLAYRAHARLLVFLSTIGADGRASQGGLRDRGIAEEQIRASGLPWVIIRPELLWGPGDVFTNELAHLLRHLPFVPVPRSRTLLAPLHVGDAARALVRALALPELTRQIWTMMGPEELGYAEILDRVAGAIGLEGRRRLRVPAWSVRLGAALEERIAHRPKSTRSLIDRLVKVDVHDASVTMTALTLDAVRRPMTVDALRIYLHSRLAPDEQLHLGT